MQSPNPNPTNKSTSTTNKSLSSPHSPPSNHGSPKETNPLSKSSQESMDKETLKTTLEVLEELKVSKNKMGHDDSKDVVADGSTVVMGEGVNGGQARNSSPYPICPKCRIELFTRKSTIDHMKKISDCDPISPSNPTQPDNNKGKTKTQFSNTICDPIGSSNPTQPDHNRGGGLDLNEVQPMEIEEGSSNAAPKHVERKGYGFDLNELPPPDEEDDDSMTN